MQDYRSRCPIAAGLDEIGDKWSLVIIRDLVAGKRRFGEFLDSPEHIPSNILASRMKRLVGAGIVRKQPYSERPPRFEYLLTEKGAALLPVLQHIARWGECHIAGRWTPPAWFYDARPQDALRGPQVTRAGEG